MLGINKVKLLERKLGKLKFFLIVVLDKYDL